MRAGFPELVRRLRTVTDQLSAVQSCRQAADAIEALEHVINRLDRYIERMTCEADRLSSPTYRAVVTFPPDDAEPGLVVRSNSHVVLVHRSEGGS